MVSEGTVKWGSEENVLKWAGLAVARACWMGFVRGRGKYSWPRLGTEESWGEWRGMAWRVRGGIQREVSTHPCPPL